MSYSFGENFKTPKVVGNTAPIDKDFTARVKRETTNPVIDEKNIQKLVEEKALEVEVLENQLQEIGNKIKSGRLYLEMLAQYNNLTEAEKREVRAWLKKNQKVIKKYKQVRDLKNQNKLAKEVVASVDIDLEYAREIKKIQAQGVDPKAKLDLVSYRPVKEVFDLRSKDGEIPKIKGVTPKIKPVSLNKQGIATFAPGEFSGLAESTSDTRQELNTDLQKFIKILPSSYEMKAPARAAEELREISQKEGALVERLPRLEWDAKNISEAIQASEAEYLTIQGEIVKKLLDFEDADVATALGILVEIRPERFPTATTLLAAMKDVLSHINTLGSFGDSAPSPTEQVNQLLASEIAMAQALVSQIDAKKDEITRIVTNQSPPEPKTSSKYPYALILAAIVVIVIAAGLLRRK